MKTFSIPESVSGKDLAEAMEPLLQLLGVPLDLMMSNGLHIDFVEGVTVTAAIPLDSGVTIDNPDRVPALPWSEVCATTLIKVTGPGPDLKVRPTVYMAKVV